MSEPLWLKLLAEAPVVPAFLEEDEDDRILRRLKALADSEDEMRLTRLAAERCDFLEQQLPGQNWGPQGFNGPRWGCSYTGD